MLGWNLGACVNSLYKLRLVGSGRPLFWGKYVVVLLDWLSVSEFMVGAGRPQFLHHRAPSGR